MGAGRPTRSLFARLLTATLAARRVIKKGAGRSRRPFEIRSIGGLAAFGLNGLNDVTNLRAELGAEGLILKIDIGSWFAGDRLETEQLSKINLLRFLHIELPLGQGRPA